MFLKKVYYYLFRSYHRPSAKFLHLLVLLKSLLFNKKSKILSEKFMLLKNPPISTIFYNFFGRFLIISLNFIYIIFFNKFFKSKTKINSSYNKEIPKNMGSDSSPWPNQAMHLFEVLKDLDQISFELIEENYKASILSLESSRYYKDLPWWLECRKEFKSIFLNKENKINREELKNFRNNKNTKAALLADQNFLSGNLNNRFNKLKSLSLINLYHKISEVVDINILRSSSESYSGNNYCLNYRGQRLSHRILRYAYYTSQILNNVNFCDEKKKFILDLGGGYGGLSRSLFNYFNNATFIIIEIPEVCAFAYYFLKNNYSKKKIGTFKDFEKIKNIDQLNLAKFDFVILPQTCIEKFNSNIIDLSINTTSIGEMDDEVQNYYVSHLERITKKYLYSVNRPEMRKEKYNAQGYYNLNFNCRWNALIYKYSHTYHIEFLGKKNNST